jgi:hypothetical protein
MNITSCTQAPVWLNGWKHHLGFLYVRIRESVCQENASFPDFFNSLNIMGSSLSDVYSGQLTPEQIRKQVINFLKENRKDSPAEYLQWLGPGRGDFREVTLDDGSVWTLLQGKDTRFFIHIHPSRYSPHSRRVKTNLLRTAAATRFWGILHPNEKPGLVTINHIRAQYLNLSPVDERHLKGINNVLQWLDAHCVFYR